VRVQVEINPMAHALFDEAIHVVGAGSGYHVALTIVSQIFHEVFICKDAIVGMILLDGVLIPLAKLFVSLFAD